MRSTGYQSYFRETTAVTTTATMIIYYVSADIITSWVTFDSCFSSNSTSSTATASSSFTSTYETSPASSYFSSFPSSSSLGNCSMFAGTTTVTATRTIFGSMEPGLVVTSIVNAFVCLRAQGTVHTKYRAQRIVSSGLNKTCHCGWSACLGICIFKTSSCNSVLPRKVWSQI